MGSGGRGLRFNHVQRLDKFDLWDVFETLDSVEILDLLEKRETADLKEVALVDGRRLRETPGKSRFEGVFLGNPYPGIASEGESLGCLAPCTSSLKVTVLIDSGILARWDRGE